MQQTHSLSIALLVDKILIECLFTYHWRALYYCIRGCRGMKRTMAESGLDNKAKEYRRQKFFELYPDVTENGAPLSESDPLFGMNAEQLTDSGAAFIYRQYAKEVREYEMERQMQQHEKQMQQQRLQKKQQMQQQRLQMQQQEAIVQGFKKQLQDRIEQMGEEFGKAVSNMSNALHLDFNIRCPCLLNFLPNDFILSGGKTSNEDILGILRKIYDRNATLFSDFKNFEDFRSRFTGAQPQQYRRASRTTEQARLSRSRQSRHPNSTHRVLC